MKLRFRPPCRLSSASPYSAPPPQVIAFSQSHRSNGRRDEGFTLGELLVVISLVAILAAISMRSFLAYDKSSMHSGAVRETVALLRSAHTKAVSEGNRVECQFSPSKLEIFNSSNPTLAVTTYRLDANLKYLVSGSFAGGTLGFSGSANAGRCHFDAKGTAAPGFVAIERVDTGRKLYIEVTGLTGRVTYCADPSGSDICET